MLKKLLQESSKYFRNSLRYNTFRNFSSAKLNIKQLREITGAPLMKCKEALEKFEGDINQAKQFLFEKNLATAEKKSDRDTNCGILAYSMNPSSYIGFAEIGCETDFVLKNENFLDFSDQVSEMFSSFSESVNYDKEESEGYLRDQQKDLWNENQQLIAKIQENIRINSISVDKFSENSNQLFGSYMHTTYRSRLGKSLTYVVLSYSKSEPLSIKEEKFLSEIAEEIAVHVFCKQPDYVSDKEMPEDELAEIKQSILETLDETLLKKPKEIQEKIIKGRLSKVLDDRLLMSQKLGDSDEEITIESMLKSISSDLGFDVTIKRFKTVKI
jgi:elongation factor Ts